ncbi:Vacuolar protein-sorting-associated protein 36 [Ancistrocladus abbreviatus]
MSHKWLPPAELTASGRPLLTAGEVECFTISAVDIEPEGDSPAHFTCKSGVLVLTTHRLIWISDSIHENGAVYIPLSRITHIFSHKKSLKSIFASPRVRFQLSVSSSGHLDPNVSVSGTGSGSRSRSIVVTLVMRGKADNHDLFVTRFWEAWRGRAWESLSPDSGPRTGQSSGAVGSDVVGVAAVSSVAIRMPVVGVAGILRKEQEMWESTDKSLQDAFQDLNALMSKAKEMVMLADKMRQKLLSGSNNQASAASDEEMGSKEEMQDWLLSVGIISPVTKESAGALYHQQLSRQLADFVKIPLERAGGMINLIDIYCLFNRARGTELISPDDLLQACSLWEKFDVPVMLRKFESGVMVIQNKSHSDDEVFARIKALVLKSDALRTGVSASDAAMTLGIAPAMAKEHLLNAESKGLLCRDISPDGFRFFVNIFYEIDQDNAYLVRGNGIYATWVASAINSSS